MYLKVGWAYLFSIFIWYFGCICYYRKDSILEHFVSISVSVLYGIARVLFISIFMFILFYIQIISKLTNIFGFSVLFVHLEIVYKFSQIKIFYKFSLFPNINLEQFILKTNMFEILDHLAVSTLQMSYIFHTVLRCSFNVTVQAPTMIRIERLHFEGKYSSREWW
jgi:hypothetical protein